MQLNLALLDQPDPPPGLSAAEWERIDEAARIAALEMLARLIARMLVSKAEEEASDE